MTWGAFPWLYAELAVVALAIVMGLAGLRHRRRLQALFTGAVADRVLPTSVKVRRTLRDLCVLGGLFWIFVALAEPQLGERVFTIEQKGVDVVVAVDLSLSMNATDVDPSRLERARREILDLLDVMEADRVGLVIYAGGAYPRMPLTADHDALRLLVEELDTSSFQAQGSELGVAIRTALDLLGTRRGEAGQAILVLSDGEVHRPADAVAAAQEAARAGVRIFALGIGQTASPIPLGDGTWLTDTSGQTVLTVPTAGVLTEVARATGGAYVQSVASASDVEQLYRREMRGTMKAGSQGKVQKKVAQSGYQCPLAVGLSLLLLGYWLGEGRRRWGAALGRAAAVLVLVVPLAAEAGTRAEGDALYRAGRYPEAVEVFTELSMEEPTNPDVWGRLAAARYRAGDAEGAARAWEQQDRLLGGDPDASFNAGNAHYKAHRLDEALERYDDVLAREPDHEGALRNKQLVEREIEARRQNQAKPPPESQQGGQAAKEPSEGQQGDPQEGQGGQGEPGGEEGDEEQDGQQAENGGQEGEPQPGQGGKPTEGQGPEGQGGSEGQQTDEERTAEETGQASPDQLAQGDGQPGDAAAAAGADGAGGDGGPITAAQADRLLEGVEEGRPRIVIPGDAQGGKPW